MSSSIVLRTLAIGAAASAVLTSLVFRFAGAGESSAAVSAPPPPAPAAAVAAAPPQPPPATARELLARAGQMSAEEFAATAAVLNAKLASTGSPEERRRDLAARLASPVVEVRRAAMREELAEDREHELPRARRHLGDPALLPMAAQVLLIRPDDAVEPDDIARVRAALERPGLDAKGTSEVTWLVFRALAHADSPDSVTYAGRLIDGSDNSYRYRALSALSSLPPAQSVPLLLPALDHPDVNVKKQAYQSLVYLAKGTSVGLRRADWEKHFASVLPKAVRASAAKHRRARRADRGDAGAR